MPNKVKRDWFCSKISRVWSEWGDSNSRRLEPKSSALPTGPHPDMKLRKIACYGQICGQGNSITKFRNFQEGKRGEFRNKIKKFAPLWGATVFCVQAPKANCVCCVYRKSILRCAKKWCAVAFYCQTERWVGSINPIQRRLQRLPEAFWVYVRAGRLPHKIRGYPYRQEGFDNFYLCWGKPGTTVSGFSYI